MYMSDQLGLTAPAPVRTWSTRTGKIFGGGPMILPDPPESRTDDVLIPSIIPKPPVDTPIYEELPFEPVNGKLAPENGTVQPLAAGFDMKRGGLLLAGLLAGLFFLK